MGSHPGHGERGFTLAEILCLIVLILVVLFVLLPTGHHCCGRASNERNAFTSLKTLCSAEEYFRVNDSDGNGVKDYWTGDVKGLYTLTSARVAGANANNTVDPSIKLIELSVAGADADSTFYPAGGENIDLSNFAVPSAKAGHWFAAMRTSPSGALRQDRSFAFVAFPDTQSAGKYVFIVDETNTILRMAATGPCRTGSSNPPGLAGVSSSLLVWPDESRLKSSWSKLD
jgi:hypothetical protein